MKYKTLVISIEKHEKLKTFCKEKKIKITDFLSNIIDDYIDTNIEESDLPQILKNSKGEVVETIICSEISSETKNNMPKSLILIKKSKDGAGYIGNYNLK